jgi:hypothetical protein
MTFGHPQQKSRCKSLLTIEDWPMNIHSFRSFLSLSAGILTALLLSACGGGGGGGAAMGSVNVRLTDAPSCGYDHVYITVDHLAISSDGNGWITIPVDSSVKQPIDLLELTNGVMLTLGAAPLPAGTYQQVRLVLKANGNGGSTGNAMANSLMLTGSPTPTAMTTPSAQQSGYKILGPFTVQAGTTADLVLDFNACKSIVVAGASGKYLLKPVVRATAQAVSGTISGFALAGSQVSAYAEPAGTFITGTVVPTVSTSAQFNLGPILQSSATPGSSVDVVIVPPATSGQGTIVIQGVPVEANTTTWISPSDGTSSFNANPATGSGTNPVSGTVMVAGSPANSPVAANVVASQTVTGTGRTYEIAATTSDSSAGVYGLSLAASGPWLGTYSGTITTTPIALTQDVDASDAGVYSIAASDSLSTSVPQPANVSAGAVTGLNFVLSQ